MNVKVKELKGKVANSNRRTMLIAGICGDDLIVAKAIDANQKDVFKAIDKYTGELKDVSDDTLGDIANNAIVALKEISKGKDSTERAKLFIEALTSLTFESKDELTLDDYCHAVCMLRLLEKDILPEDKIIKTQYSRKSGGNSKVKNFVAGGKGVSVENENFLLAELEIANKWAGTTDMSEEDKKKMDADEQKCSETIRKTVTEDDYLNKKYGCRLQQFSDWTAEQIYGLKPETVESINAIKDDQCLVKDLFEQYIGWVKANDPNGYIEYLKDSTQEKKNPIVETKAGESESKSDTTKKAESKKQEENPKSEKPGYERRPRVIIPTLPSFSDASRISGLNRALGMFARAKA